MAKIISRGPKAVNEHQNQNGLEWSRTEQNRLANELSASVQRENLKNEVGVLQIERGDTLRAIQKGLTGKINGKQLVDYRSNIYGSSYRPKVVDATNKIQIGQYVWIENNVVIVADTPPTSTVSSPTKPQKPNQPAGPKSRPNATNWAPAFPTSASHFVNLEPTEKALLIQEYPSAINKNFDISSVETASLPSNLGAMLSQAAEVISVPQQTRFLISKEQRLGYQGVFLGGADIITLTGRFVPGGGTFLINKVPGDEYGVQDTEEFRSTVLNELVHSITDLMLDKYYEARVKKALRTGAKIPHFRQMNRDLMQNFSHPDVPLGLYSLAEFDELQSDAFSFSTYPQGIIGRPLVYGTDPLDPLSYRLNRDFTALHLSNFLTTQGKNYTPDQVKAAFRRLFSADDQGNGPLFGQLVKEFHFNDPAFQAYIQPKYQAVGEAFYAHIATEIKSL